MSDEDKLLYSKFADEADKLEGYEYKYGDGRAYFRCGSELICLPPVTHQELPEILKLLNTQHQYYLSKG
ncbi:hypothetical protein [Paenibacillus sp. NPDC057934]|uniref:hypothetical protein n=1 Tax=Paenibacillus sp. NPDC057934 TaxID=3346282 RepID=UPI0036DC4F8F